MQNQNYNSDPLLISYLTLRKIVGLLGIFLPAVLAIGNIAMIRKLHIQPSISDYYYTDMRDVFVGMLCAVALFLLAYKGYDRRDKNTSSLAGLFGFGVAFFPTTPDGVKLSGIVTIGNIHYACAAMFFAMLGYMSYFLFTQSSGKVTPQKIVRNKVYRACGIAIFSCIVIIPTISSIALLKEHLARLHPTFSLETVALFCFGFSWLVKGEFLLKDKEEVETVKIKK